MLELRFAEAAADVRKPQADSDFLLFARQAGGP